jgi:hypothetical protein
VFGGRLFFGTTAALLVNRIRAGRSNPGLRPQHLCGLSLVTKLCTGKLSGGCESSMEVMLQPKALRAGSYEERTGTAGSCTLLVQGALPCMLLAAPADTTSTATLHGGTDVAFSPPFDFLAHVLLPTLRRMLPVEVQVCLTVHTVETEAKNTPRLARNTLDHSCGGTHARCPPRCRGAASSPRAAVAWCSRAHRCRRGGR